MRYIRQIKLYLRLMTLRIKIVYLNNHQADLDKYANDFRKLGNYKGDILDAQKKIKRSQWCYSAT